MGKLTGKIVVVTGAAKGIGFAIAKQFIIDDAAKVIILDYDREQLNAAEEALGDRAMAICCDISDIDSVHSAFDAAYEKMGRIDILVNNAGITRDAMLVKMSIEQWQKVIDVDLTGVFYCTKQVVASMKAQKYGKIVNISSISAFGNVGQANYSAAKAGILGFTRCAAKELARYNITVNAICPSMIYTDILKTIPKKNLEEMLSLVPARRLGQPKEVATLASFLSCDDSSFVTGEAILVSGGMTM